MFFSQSNKWNKIGLNEKQAKCKIKKVKFNGTIIWIFSSSSF